MRATLFLSVLVAAIGAAPAAGAPNRDPDAAELVFSDMDLFWKAFDAAKPGNRAEVLRAQYLEKGSVGLKEFLRVRIRSADKLAATIDKHPKYYAALRGPSGKAAAHKDAIRASFRKLKELYEPAVFPNVYFVIGSMNSAGTITDTGLLIGVDMYGMNEDAPVEELGRWHRAVVKPIKEIPYIVAHELIHYQQKYPKDNSTLLATAIREGSADFVGELVSGGMINSHLHTYGNRANTNCGRSSSRKWTARTSANGSSRAMPPRTGPRTWVTTWATKSASPITSKLRTRKQRSRPSWRSRISKTFSRRVSTRASLIDVRDSGMERFCRTSG
jgi:hypothetical protein